MLVFAAIGVFGAGMLAIAAGIPIKEFGFGNTLILSGVLAWCTSAIMLTLWACVRELRSGADRPARSVRSAEAEPGAALQRPSPAPEPVPSAAGWPESIPERAPAAPLPSAPPPGEPRAPRRNLLFASNRKPRDAAPAAEPVSLAVPAASPPELRPLVAAEEPRTLPPRRLEAALPARPPRPASSLNPRDPVTAPAPLPPAAPPPPAPPPVAQSPLEAIPPRDEPLRSPPARPDKAGDVAVLKSGVVDGMAYWLYSDGSIEAQMPEGMMRFTSIDELRAHLDRRP